MITSAVNLDRAGSGRVSRVVAVTRNPAYERVPGTQDAAVLTLAEPVSAPAIGLALPSTAPVNLPGTPALIAGYGFTSSGSGAPDQLRVAPTVIQPPDYCEAVYPTFDPTQQVCTIDAPGEETASCSGDSGGPLFIGRGENAVQVGIAGFGASDCDGGSPDFDTAVSAVSAWIETEIEVTPAAPPRWLRVAAARRDARLAAAQVAGSPRGAEAGVGRRARVRGLHLSCRRTGRAGVRCQLRFTARGRAYEGPVVLRSFQTATGAASTTARWTLHWTAASCHLGCATGTLSGTLSAPLLTD